MKKAIKSFLDKVGITSDQKPHLLYFVPLILLVGLLFELPIAVIVTWTKSAKDIARHYEILYKLLTHPFLVIGLVGLLGPIFETIVTQTFSIELLRYFRFPSKLILIISALLFSIAHFLWGFLKIFVMFPAGLLYAYAYWRLRRYSFLQSFGTVSLIHGIHNTILILILLGEAHLESKNVYGYQLIKASKNNNLAAVRMLIDKGANVNYKLENTNQTALLWAIAEKHTDIAKILLDKGADPNIRDNYSNSPLIKAIYYDDLELIDDLIKHKANVNQRDSAGNPAILLALRYGQMDIFKNLIEHGADVNAKGDWGKTILMEAVVRNNPEMVKFLIENKVDINAVDNNGWTALKMAKSWSFSPINPEIFKMLQHAGARE